MTTLTIVWLVLPLMAGLMAYLLPRLARSLGIGVAIASIAYGLALILRQTPFSLELLDSFGVTLMADPLSGFFILTNGLVTAAVILYCWSGQRSAFFFAQLYILHGSLNSAFLCADFVSLYVALEVISIAVFLLIAYPRTNRSIWVGLRYLFVSNTVMLFYLVGAVLVYEANQSFAFSGLAQAAPEAQALILLGLLTKGGVFISGLWLPLTHSEAEVPVSAILSGVAIKAGIFPLVRCAQMLDSVDPIIRLFGLGTAFLGISFALFEKDIKRILAFSTISQVGFVLAAPPVAGFYALGHGLAKTALFLTAGSLPSRNLDNLRQQPMATPAWATITAGGLSLAGMPLLTGFASKALTLENLLSWQVIGMNTAAIGSAIVFARVIFLPHQPTSEQKMAPGFWPAILLLGAALVAANAFYIEAYSLTKITKALAIIALGWLIYFGVIRRMALLLPRTLELLEHLIGVMSLALIGLFWLVLA
ncbi:cation:proton antiporter [Pseudanabaena sp. FACHB-2040]|uniref:cation:proton antiporter n=1 Tax=Pseudanabaena sp. FACHB-2040 TaxID=2692859 RepID=UPI001686D866|nr:cation:proton antiporter [Pseudanabaena sp. FACHB-2040]MBD2258963.1 cation:proton antiporter [Pseudanabaena sp. FACHB-2040]